MGYAYDFDEEQHHLTATLDLELPAPAAVNPLRFSTTTEGGLVESPAATHAYIMAALNITLPLEK